MVGAIQVPIFEAKDSMFEGILLAILLIWLGILHASPSDWGQYSQVNSKHTLENLKLRQEHWMQYWRQNVPHSKQYWRLFLGLPLNIARKKLPIPSNIGGYFWGYLGKLEAKCRPFQAILEAILRAPLENCRANPTDSKQYWGLYWRLIFKNYKQNLTGSKQYWGLCQGLRNREFQAICTYTYIKINIYTYILLRIYTYLTNITKI